MVNQKLALKSGFEPCSTIKIVAALAGLNEGIVNNGTVARMGRSRMNLTEALAHSNNYYFASIGEELGFERIIKYGQLMGIGERATLDVPQEEPGRLPSAPPRGGLGMMTSFGEGIKLTPLELASIMMTVSNGGKMWYLQYPRSQEEVVRYTARLKRQIDFAKHIPDIKPGMSGAVEFGTARRASYDQSETILGKTGTCTDENSPTHLGWFGSFNESGKKKIVVVVLLTGGRPVNGPVASGIAGQVYRNLAKTGYFNGSEAQATPIAMTSTGACCALKASFVAP
jgi:penicillin-binding protein 2